MSACVELPEDAPLGLIAGKGDFPLAVCREARRFGVPYIGVIAMREDTSPEIDALADRVDWMYPGQLSRAIRCLRRQDIHHLICAGQVTPSRLFTGLRPDLRALGLLCRLRERNAETIFSAIADEFEKNGIRVLPSTLVMEHALAGKGILGRRRPTRREREDVELGLRIARATSRLNIGQTVVVKRGTVLAVEAFEGTDRAIRRGGELGHGGVTVVKVAKPFHDMRFDVPCVGMRTVESLELARARVFAVQAARTLIIDGETVVAACNHAKIALLGVVLDDEPAPSP